MQALEALAATNERLAASNERIVEMADEERQANYEGGPPYCPHCGMLNPKVSMSRGAGPMADFVLAGTCECSKVFYGVPEGWQVFKTREELERAGQE